MSDERMRELDRRAFETGDDNDQRQAINYRIGRLSIEIPLEPTLLKKLGMGRYDGQVLWHDSEDGITHPCVKWQTDNEEQFWDVMSEECVWKRPTSLVTMSLFGTGALRRSFGTVLSSYGQVAVLGTPGPGEPGMMDALRNIGEQHQNPVGEIIDVIENPLMPSDQMILIEPQPLSPFLREYPARFEDHAADAMRYAVEAAPEKQGDDDEAEGQAGRRRTARHPSHEGE